MNRQYELRATTQKSYYGKAIVIEENGNIMLRSYNTIVCKIDRNGDFIRLWGGYSVTTMNHINDFRKSNGLAPLNKKAWCSLPCENTERYKVEFSNGFVNWTAGIIFDDYEEASDFADKVCERHNWRFGASVNEA